MVKWIFKNNVCGVVCTNKILIFLIQISWLKATHYTAYGFNTPNTTCKITNQETFEEKINENVSQGVVLRINK